MTGRDVGELGESELRSWAAQVGFLANKAERDRTGWDFLIELPESAAAQDGLVVPLDRRDAPIKCFVQVKSSDARPGRRQIKLDNALRFVTNPEPSFFLFLEFAGKRHPQSAFLVHVDRDLISRVLRRVRELSAIGDEALHLRTITVSYTTAHQIKRPLGRQFADSIRNHVGDVHEYVREKLQFLRDVGYEEAVLETTLGLKLPDVTTFDDIQDRLVDLSLGLIPPVEITGYEHKDVRFGISMPTKGPDFVGGKLSPLSDPDAQGSVVFIDKERTKRVTLNADVHFPKGVSEVVERRFHKIRFAGQLFDVVVPLQGKQFSCKTRLPHSSTLIELRHLYEWASLMELIGRVGGTSESLDAEFRINGKQLSSGSARIERQLDPLLLQVAGTFIDAWKLAQQVDIENSTRVTAHQLHAQAAPLRFTRQLIEDQSPSPVTVNFRLAPLDGDLPVQVCLPQGVLVTLGEYLIATFVSLVGQADIVHRESEGTFIYKFVSTAVTVERVSVFGPDDDLDTELERVLLGVADKYASRYKIILLRQLLYDGRQFAAAEQGTEDNES
jgi:hypothetical protein